MKKLSIIFGTALVLIFSASAANAGSPKTNDVKTTDAVASPTESKTETTTQVIYYWFDANNATYLGHTATSGCDNSTSDACALGYTSVSNPSNPQKPNRADDLTETGIRP